MDDIIVDIIDLEKRMLKEKPFKLLKNDIRAYLYSSMTSDIVWCSNCDYTMLNIYSVKYCPKCLKSTELVVIKDCLESIVKYLFKYKGSIILEDIYMTESDIFSALL